jgi:hypothetical protein
VWRGLRKAIGTATDGREAAGPVDGLEDQWRTAKARVVARVNQMAEAAALQALPDRASYHLPVYESALKLAPSATDEERRAAIATAYTEKLGALIPEIRARLQTIDAGLDVRTPSSSTTTESHFGQYLADRTLPAWVYGTRIAAMMPNYATHFVLLVPWTGCPAGIPPAATRATVERYLNSALPTWCDYLIYTSGKFYLDGFLDSHLDLSTVG